MRSVARPSHVIDLLAADVVSLESTNEQLSIELRIAREMLSELLDITYQALAHIHRTRPSA